MRPFLTFVFLSTVIGSISAQETTGESQSLGDLLRQQKAIAYHINSQTGLYSLRLMSPELVVRTQAYYKNRKENIAKANELQSKSARLRARTRDEKPISPEVELEIKKLNDEYESLRPIGSHFAGDITRRGSDFIGVREFGTTRELLIPFSRIQVVILGE